MPQPANRGPFKLPQIGWSRRGVKLLSLRQQGLKILGHYLPHEGAVVVDPLWTQAKSPEGISAHEEAHQFLGINTAFGLLTQVLFLIARHRPIEAAVEQCLARQWGVQELLATYVEMSYVALNRPTLLSESIRGLPSGRLGEPPYREVFEAMHRFLPVDLRQSADTLETKATLVRLLTAAAMNSSCLQDIGRMGDEAGLLAAMQDAPSHRLERIMNALIRRGALVSLLDRTKQEFARSKGSYSAQDSPGVVMWQELAALVPDVEIVGEAELLRQAEVLARFYPAISDRSLRMTRLAEDPLPKIMESREKEQLGLRERPPRELPESAFDAMLAETVHKNLGITLELAIRNDEATFVTARRYYLNPHAAPKPAEGEEVPPQPLPKDIAGVMSARRVRALLQSYPALPHVAIFIDDSWRVWQRIPQARDRFSSGIQICRQTHLAADLVKENVLAFENLGAGAEVFVSAHGPGQYVGCFFSRGNPRIYGLQKVATDLGLKLFERICSDLGIESCPDPQRDVANFSLIQMVGDDFFYPANK